MMSSFNSFLEKVPYTIFVLLCIDFFVLTLEPVKLNQFAYLLEFLKTDKNIYMVLCGLGFICFQMVVIILYLRSQCKDEVK